MELKLGGYLPPSCIAESPRVHLSHVAHADDPDDKTIFLALTHLEGRHPLKFPELNLKMMKLHHSFADSSEETRGGEAKEKCEVCAR